MLKENGKVFRFSGKMSFCDDLWTRLYTSMAIHWLTTNCSLEAVTSRCCGFHKNKIKTVVIIFGHYCWDGSYERPITQMIMSLLSPTSAWKIWLHMYILLFVSFIWIIGLHCSEYINDEKCAPFHQYKKNMFKLMRFAT